MLHDILACVADDPSIQPKLPQVLLGNEHQLTLETMRSIADDLPRSIMVWRQKTSWNSKVKSSQNIHHHTQIAACLAPQCC